MLLLRKQQLNAQSSSGCLISLFPWLNALPCADFTGPQHEPNPKLSAHLVKVSPPGGELYLFPGKIRRGWRHRSQLHPSGADLGVTTTNHDHPNFPLPPTVTLQCLLNQPWPRPALVTGTAVQWQLWTGRLETGIEQGCWRCDGNRWVRAAWRAGGVRRNRTLPEVTRQE